MNKKQRVVEIQKQKPNRTESFIRTFVCRVGSNYCVLIVYITFFYLSLSFFLFYILRGAAAIP